MKPLNTRFLTLLITLAFLGFSISVLAGKPDKCSPWPECNGGDGQPTLYNVTPMGGDMGVHGTDWEIGNKGQIEWGQFWPAGTGSVDLGIFLIPEGSEGAGGPFSGERGANCFGLHEGSPPMVQGGFRQQTNGNARGRLWFNGRTDDAKKSVGYMLTLEGQFEDSSFPSTSGSNILTMMTWEMEMTNGGKRIRNISCTGAGVFYNPAVIDIWEKP